MHGLITAAAALAVLTTGAATSGAAATVTVSASGPPVDVWAAVDTLHKCHFIDVPDIPARAYADDKGVTHMIVGSTNYHHM
eukprot:COSAG04_NODE_3824_length_2493_cov_1.680033_5_plen_81_part_00